MPFSKCYSKFFKKRSNIKFLSYLHDIYSSSDLHHRHYDLDFKANPHVYHYDTDFKAKYDSSCLCDGMDPSR